LGNLVVDVEEEPDAETLSAAGFTPLEIQAGETLFGLYEPVINTGDWSDSPGASQIPHRVRIFTRPLLEACPDMGTLRREVWMTVIHELAHHFGWTERDLDSFELGLEPQTGIFLPPEIDPKP
jgi:predicted Zn-dependent protease with MMP-like domain